MNAKENSDESIVPATSANNGGAETSAESTEGRDSGVRQKVSGETKGVMSRQKVKTKGVSDGLILGQ
jgi:hypothetical protein